MAITTTMIVTALVVTVISTAVSFAISTIIASSNSGMQDNKKQKEKDPGVRAQVPPDTTSSLPVVYGNAYLGGRFVDAVITLKQDCMFYTMAVSCISPDATFGFYQDTMYYGDRKIVFSDYDSARVTNLIDGAGNVDTSIDGYLWIYMFTSDYDGNITSATGNPAMPWDIITSTGDYAVAPEQAWPTTGRRMNGLAFAVIRLRYNRDAGTTQLQPITFHCTQYFGGDQNNVRPGEVLRDYLMNDIYGCAIPEEQIDLGALNDLNIYSDEYITFNDYEGNPQTQPRYRINGVIDTNQNVLQNIDNIVTACDSWLCYETFSGQWTVKINKAESVSYAFNDNNLIGPIDLNLTDITQTPNQIEVKFPDATNRDQYNYAFIKVPEELLAPNEPVNKQSSTYELVNNSVQVLYLANRVLEQNREDLNVTINTTYDGIQVEAGDVVSVTNAAYGWNEKQFRVMQVKENSDAAGNLTASLQLYEYNPLVYDNFDITQFVPAGNTNLPSAGYFSTLIAPTVTDPQPEAVMPSFDVNCFVPATGRTTTISLFYTTSATPADTDWKMFGSQTLTSTVPFAPNSTVTFANIYLTAGTYYFAYKASNNAYSSQLSTKSTAFVWTPDPTSIRTFTTAFVPAAVQVPYDGTPDFTGVTFQLHGANGLGPVDFSMAQTDSDVSFVNNSWRIGGSDVTGFGDIVESNITVGDPTDGGTYAQFPQPTAMTTDVATVTVPVRYKDGSGDISQATPASIQVTYARQGDPGEKAIVVNLYQWSTSLPSDPSGTSTYTWATGTNASYTGGGGWSTTVPANSGVPLLQLYTAAKTITVPTTEAVTLVDWTTDYSIQSVSANGAAGVQSAKPTVYQWAITIPSGPTGTSTYTWSTDTFTPTPSGWSTTAGTSPSPGYTLWAASVTLVDSATVTTSSINWTTATISAVGYAGDDGATGTTGASARICYTKTTLSSLDSTPSTITTSGSSSFPPNNSWGTGTVWQATPPVISAGESVWQSDGIYSPTTGNTVWNVPYLSALKVGSLSAITTNTGSLNVTGTIQASTAAISGTTMTGSGMVVYNTGQFAVGNSTKNITFNGTTMTINGDFVATGNIIANAVSVQARYNYGTAAGTGSTFTGSFTLPAAGYVLFLAALTLPNDNSVFVDDAGTGWVTGASNAPIFYPLSVTTLLSVTMDGTLIYDERPNCSFGNVVSFSATKYISTSGTKSFSFGVNPAPGTFVNSGNIPRNIVVYILANYR